MRATLNDSVADLSSQLEQALAAHADTLHQLEIARFFLQVRKQGFPFCDLCAWIENVNCVALWLLRLVWQASTRDCLRAPSLLHAGTAATPVFIDLDTATRAMPPTCLCLVHSCNPGFCRTHLYVCMHLPSGP